jgi:hypothetical protein
VKLFTLKPPAITAIAPTSGTIGTVVTITGKYFGPTQQGTSGVSFNGTAVTSYPSWTDTSIKCVVPSGATTGNVTVTTPIGPSNGKPFTLMPPHITAIAPTSGKIGTNVTITGKYFGPTRGTSSVSFNGTAATSYTSWTDTSIKCAVPSGANTGNVTVTTPIGISNGKLFSLLTVTTTSLPGADVGTAYNKTLAASHGTPPYTWTITIGTLPAGLLLNQATGVISGTPTTIGTSNFTVMVTDSANPAGTATQALSITVTELTVTTTSLPGADVGTAYSRILAASGGTLPYTWTITVGALPAGLHLNQATGVISGTPTTKGTSNFTVKATDSLKPAGTATQALSITVTDLAVTTASLPGGTVGAAYNQTLTASGGTALYTWTITVGALPAGLLLNQATGVISGIPTKLEISNFTVMVTDSANPAGTATRALSITTDLAVTTTSLPRGKILTTYNQTLAASGGTPPYTWSFTGGLPLGLGLNHTTGVISGFLDAIGTWKFTVKVTDSAIPAVTATQDLSITVSF